MSIVLTALHFAIHHSGILTLASNVMNLRVEALRGDGRIEDVVQIDRQDLQEAVCSCSAHSVASVIHISPRIRATRQASIRKGIKDTLVGIVLGAEEDLRR